MKPKILIPVFMLLISGGCGIYYVVSSDQDSATDFTKYKTYAWLPDKDNSNNVLNNQIMRNNIKNYFGHELVDNYGFTANTVVPDVLIEFAVTVVNKVRTEEHPVTNTVPNYSYGYPYSNNSYPYANPYSGNSYYTPYPNPHNYGGYNNINFSNNNYSGYGYQTTYVKEQHNYTQNSITINMIDRVRNELVWTVTAQADIYDVNPPNVQSDIHPAIHRMLEYFPVKRIVPPKNNFIKK